MVIDEKVTKRAWKIWDIGQTEPVYERMLQEMAILEDRYEIIMEGLPEAQEDIVRDFVSQCEGMSWRMLQIACALMRFPDERDEETPEQ